MRELGLKLWSINTDHYFDEAQKLYDREVFDYIELYTVPETLDTIKKWKELEIPFVIHAPHFMHGMNLANRENLAKNLKLTKETKKFADLLDAKIIIYHPGMNGNIKETARQFNLIYDNRIVVENKPYIAPLNTELICCGSSIEEIKFILDNTNVGFCLDIGHSICAANSNNINPFKQLVGLLNLHPKIYHLSDGESQGIIDRHLNFGKGDFDLEKILNLLPENAKITLETNKNSKENLSDFFNDLEYLKRIFNYNE